MLPRSLTTVTPFSKALALILFVTFPFIGFFLGTQYDRVLHNTNLAPSPMTFLFVEQAKGGTLKHVAGEWILTLVHPSRRITYFTDRPNRTFGETEFGAFLSKWQDFGFNTLNPPNAAITIDPTLNNGQNPSVMLVTLENPTYDTDTDIATFTVQPLHQPSKSMQSFATRSGELTESTFVEPSLFIDNATLPSNLRFFMFGLPIKAHTFHIHEKGDITDPYLLRKP